MISHKTALVIPCYNEAKRLNIAEFKMAVSNNANLTFIFVNDGSDDNTAEILNELTQMHPDSIRFINLEHNCGKAEAVRRGVNAAIEEHFQYIGYWDADLSTPLDAVESFLTSLEDAKADIIIGSRVRLMGKNIDRSLRRHLLGRLFATMASILLHLPVYDTQCGAKIFKNTDKLKKVFQEPFMVDWIFDVEVFARFEVLGINISGESLRDILIEYPLEQWKDVGGSKLTASIYFRAPLDLIKIAIKYSPAIYKARGGA